jgi:hypothetical protein
VAEGGTEGVVDAGQIDVDGVGPGLDGLLLPEGADPGVGANDIETPELGHRLVDTGLEG